MTMLATAASSTSTMLPVGSRWVFDVDLVDDAGVPASTAPAIVVTLPELVTVTPTPEMIAPGRWRATHTPATPGRYVATVTLDGAVAAFAAYAVGFTTAGGMPTPDDVATYLRSTSWSTEELTAALDAEAAAQRAVCDVGPTYPADLREALFRRVARNLAMRALPLAVPTGDGEGGGPTILPGSDPEVRRLERPYRRFPVA